MFLTFWGKPRWTQSEHIQHALHHPHEHDEPSHEDGHGDHAPTHGHADHGDGTGGYHPHESPFSMLIPLLLLSVGAVFAGLAFNHYFIQPESGAIFWKALSEASEKLDVDLNPRYGSWGIDKASGRVGLLEAKTPWLKEVTGTGSQQPA